MGGTFRRSREVQGFFPIIAAAPLLKFKAESLAGLAPPVSPRPGCVRAAGPGSGCFKAAGIVGGQRSEAARRGNRRIGWEGEAPAVERSGTSVGARGGARHKKRSPRPVMSDTGTCVRTHPGSPGGGSVYYGALFVTRYGVRPGKRGAILPESSE
jgi:hypothetical protein